jgi:hypothetical protein
MMDVGQVMMTVNVLPLCTGAHLGRNHSEAIRALGRNLRNKPRNLSH